MITVPAEEMPMRSRFAAAAFAALASSLSACVVVDGRGPHTGPPVHASGPPPHAPAHGYRHKHHGHELVFDATLGVYVVVAFPELWFLDGSYFRWYGERWEMGVDLNGPWRAARAEAVPFKLRERGHPHGGPPGQMKKTGKR
jgi:hypothetical protein